MIAERLKNWFEGGRTDSLFTKCASASDLFCLNSNLGLKRSENQDRTAALFVNSGGKSKQSFYCFVLCDGMGGMKQGALAASVAASTFMESLIFLRSAPPEERLLQSALIANDAVKISQGGGSTLSAVMISENAVYSLNAGDSRIYSKSREGSVKRHSKDDNLKEFVGGDDEGLLQYIGMGKGLRPHVNKINTDFEIIFLTSDGVHSLETQVFDSIVRHSNSSTDLCDRLVSTAVWTGGHDNASVVAVSNSIFDNLKTEHPGPEIAVWDNTSEMQIIWVDHTHPPSTLEAERIESSELPLKKGRDNRRTRASNKKKKDIDAPKDTFGDFS